MIKTIIRAMYSAFISIVLISTILAGWTCFTFISQPQKSVEIINVIKDMYESQKSVIIDVVDLSKLLIKDTSERTADENINLLNESELLTDQEDISLLDDSSMVKDSADKLLGIVIEPSIPEINEESLPEIYERSLDNDESDSSMNDMEMEMEMEMEMN